MFGMQWNPAADNPSYGIFPMIYASAAGTAGAVLSVRQVSSAVLLAAVAPSSLAKFIRPCIDPPQYSVGSIRVFRAYGNSALISSTSAAGNSRRSYNAGGYDSSDNNKISENSLRRVEIIQVLTR